MPTERFAQPSRLSLWRNVPFVRLYCAQIVSLVGSGLSSVALGLAANSDLDERPHIYAAHFSLSHAGWGLTYPLAGFTVTALGFETSVYLFAGLLLLVSLPIWIGTLRLTAAHIGLPDQHHHHSHSAFDPPGTYHVHEHRHGNVVHSHPHRHP